MAVLWKKDSFTTMATILFLQVLLSGTEIITGPFRGITGCSKDWFFPQRPFRIRSSTTVFGCAEICARTKACYSMNACTVSPRLVTCSAIGKVEQSCGELKNDSNCRYLYRTDAKLIMTINPCEQGGIWNVTGCICPKGYAGTFCQRYIRSCREAYLLGFRDENFYTVQPFGSPVAYTVYCQCTYGGTIHAFRRVINYRPEACPPSNLNRTWEDYKHGFGNITCEYFLGLETIYQLNRFAGYQLNIYNMYENNKAASIFIEDIEVKPEGEGYKLNFIAVTAGTGKHGDDAFINAEKPRRFCTWDRDCGDCARTVGGGWWFTSNCGGGAMTAPESQVVWPVHGVNKVIDETILQMEYTDSDAVFSLE